MCHCSHALRRTQKLICIFVVLLLPLFVPCHRIDVVLCTLLLTENCRAEQICFGEQGRLWFRYGIRCSLWIREFEPAFGGGAGASGGHGWELESTLSFQNRPGHSVLSADCDPLAAA